VLNPGIAYALSLNGLVSITASLAVLLWALEPILILILASVFLGERITRTFIALTASPSPACCWSSTSRQPGRAN
jgi:drug/metabolite transporter (DMT)-like permease